MKYRNLKYEQNILVEQKRKLRKEKAAGTYIGEDWNRDFANSNKEWKEDMFNE